MRVRELADYERLRLSVLGARVRAGAAWDVGRVRALRLSRVGVRVWRDCVGAGPLGPFPVTASAEGRLIKGGPSSGGSLVAMGIPKNCSSTVAVD